MTWWTQGKASDYRFWLANERTLLAWIRTALAFMVAAVGIDQLAPDLTPAGSREVLVLILSVVAAMLAWYAYRRWSRNERAMRHNADLARPEGLLWPSGRFAVAIIVVMVLLLLP